MTPLLPPAQLDVIAAEAMIGTDRAGRANAAATLAAATVLSPRARAGYQPREGDRPLPVCPADTSPVCSLNAAALLVQCINTSKHRLIQEWGNLAAERGQRAPDGLVPLVIECCTKHPYLQQIFAPVVGQLGQYLATRNPAWSAALPPPSCDKIEAAWSTGSSVDRKKWLAVIRNTDPRRAAPLARSTWDEESADERTAFVELFKINLDAADEAFLEFALSDRSKTVREEAAALLSKVPASRYVQRMTTRAEKFVQYIPPKRSLVGKKKQGSFVIDPPAEWDPAFSQDGLEEKPPSGIGQRAWTLRQVLSLVPPTHWSTRFAASPSDLLLAIAGNDYETDVIEAWKAAAANFNNAEWACALMLNDKVRNSDMVGLLRVWLHLPQREREAVIGDVIERLDKLPWDQVWGMLETAGWSWSRDFSERALQLLAARVPRGLESWYGAGGAIESAGCAMDPKCITQLEQWTLAIYDSAPPPRVAAALDVLRLRIELHKEFAQ